ncbi:tetratricopeptide repeat protein [Streptomyces bullii]
MVGSHRGSGYVIASRLVLTSAHVVPAVGARVTFFHPKQASVHYDATVVWRGTPRGRDDAALLRVDSEYLGSDGAPRSVDPVRWGRLVTRRPVTPCEIMGLPDVVQRERQADDILHMPGTVNRADRSVNNRYLMRLTERVESHTDPSGRPASPYAGLSGAPMYCSGLLTGVVAVDFGGFAHTRLEVVPAYVLLHDPDFRRILTENGANTVLEPAEWQGLSGLSSTGRDRTGLPGRPGLPASPAALLEAQRAVVPFRGRKELLEELYAWCQEPGLDVHLLHGPGGQGKTRLALELTDRLERARSTVVWLRSDATADAMAALGDAAVPLLVVIDYAETRVEQLTALLRTMVARTSATPFKVLLLARTADEDWWAPARRENSDTRDLLDDMLETLLSPLEPDPENRVEAYRTAVRSLARALPQVRGQQHHPWPELAEQVIDASHERNDDRLRAPGLDMALTLQMTALADLLDAAVLAASSQSVTGTKRLTTRGRRTVRVEERLLDHEAKYWHGAAHQPALAELDTKTREDALAAALLCGADTAHQGEALLGKISHLRDRGRMCHRAVTGWIAALYPSRDGRAWGSLRPDRLAEYFVGTRLTANPELAHDLLGGTTEGDRVPQDLTDAQTAQLLTVYARAAAHSAHVGNLDASLTELCERHPDALTRPAIDVATQVERPGPLVAALRRLADEPGATPDDLLALADHLPRPTHALAPLAVRVTERLVEMRRKEAEDEPACLPGLALALRRLTTRLLDLGSTREAHQAAAEAERLYARLAQEDPAYRPHHAAVLHNLSVTARGLGLREDALVPAVEAVRIYRELAEAQSLSQEPLSDLAYGLGALAQAEGELGRPQAALDAINEEVGIRRRLVEQRGDAALAALAAALNNQAIWLKECGSVEQAVEVSREAVTHYRSLAERRPDAFRAGVALSLGTYSTALNLAGRHKAALQATTEAIAIRRRLAEERPGTYLPDLALSLNSLAIDLAEVGLPEEAVARSAEAVDLYRRLAEKEPVAFGHHLANCLNTHALKLNDAGRATEAVETAREAVGRYRSLAEAEPEVFTSDLAMSLTTYATQLGRAGQSQEALRTIEESVRLYRAVAGQRPGAGQYDLACGLHNLSLWLEREDRVDEALATVDEAAGVLRGLMATGPAGRVRPQLAMTLLHKGSCLRRVGRTEEAIPVTEEAVDLYRDLVAHDPGLYESRLATALSMFWAVLSTAGRAAEAMQVLEEAVEVRGRLLAREDDAVHRPAYRSELLALGAQLSGAGRLDDAVEALQKAVAAHRALVEGDPCGPRHELAVSLSLLATSLTQAGRRLEALPIVEEAVVLLSDPARQDDAHQGLLAESLCLFGGLLHNVDRTEAEEVLRRAVAISRALPRTDVHDTVRSLSCCTLGIHLVERGRVDEGLLLARQAVDIARDRADSDFAHTSVLAWSLVLLGRLLALAPTAREEALDVSTEAVSLCERLAQINLVASEHVLAWALPHHGLRLAEAGRYEEAVRITARAVRLSRKLATAHRSAHQDHLAFSLYAHARTRLLGNIESEAARKTITEALPIWQAIAKQEPGLVAPYLDEVMATHSRLAPSRHDTSTG